ncbi:hypothetical protein E3N88_20697 [Mikania micrantha]|uniref:Uncharacterized protein n=1 Tax=Mikania micrantha TaxID=192012 RepID=A0A5N6NI63_9ASTR|nr:hypothetical protein E3N88_20697 [Mikania micrantha]
MAAQFSIGRCRYLQQTQLTMTTTAAATRVYSEGSGSVSVSGSGSSSVSREMIKLVTSPKVSKKMKLGFMLVSGPSKRGLARGCCDTNPSGMCIDEQLKMGGTYLATCVAFEDGWV